VLLTTHYMDEAERLCDRVAVVDHGKVIALGTPRALIAELGGEHVIEFTLEDEVGTAPPDPAMLAALPAVRSMRKDADHFCLSVAEPHIALPALLERLRQDGHQLASLSTRHASLEDVFVTLTGRHLRDGDAPP
jgi:ABC-2 type transport system ATP-binding protein